MKEKNSFLLYNNYKNQFDLLSDEQAGKLIKTIFAYCNGEEIEIDDLAISIVFSIIKDQIERDEEKYRQTCQKRKASGSLGGKSKAKAKQNEANDSKDNNNQKYSINNSFTKEETDNNSKSIANVANATFAKNNVANLADNDNENDNENDNDNVNDNKTPLYPPKGETGTVTPAPKAEDDWRERFTPELTKQLEKWLMYKAERREKYKPTGLKTFLTQVENKSRQYNEQDIINLIDECIANGWKGIIWDKLDNMAGNRSATGTKMADTASTKKSGARPMSYAEILQEMKEGENHGQSMCSGDFIDI